MSDNKCPICNELPITVNDGTHFSTVCISEDCSFGAELDQNEQLIPFELIQIQPTRSLAIRNWNECVLIYNQSIRGIL